MADQPSIPRQPIRAEVAGNKLDVIVTGDARLHAVLELIAQAKTSLNVLMYTFNADEAGDAVRNALDAAASRGVRSSSLSMASARTRHTHSSRF